MKYLYIALTLLISGVAFGQIEQNVNKTTGTVSNRITEIDSIRFNAGQTEMEIVFQNGTVQSHSIAAINNVTFSGCNDLTIIVDVTNPITGATWMDRNLGASQVATSSTDVDAYGNLYQWGRGADGHQCRTSPTTSTLSSTDQPGHGYFITNSSSPWDWRSPQNDDLWQGVNGINNPCPSGYRLPTEAELNAERLSWSNNNATGAFASPLKFPMAGARTLLNTGSLSFVGTSGNYWSSTVSSIDARVLNFNSSNAKMIFSNRAGGNSVRCIKD